MTPQPPTPQAAPQAPSSPTWWDVAQSIPPEAPDEAYDALRDQFFNTHVMPEVLKGGYDTELARKNFMDATVRPGHTSFPRTKVVGMEALKAFADPILGITGARTDQSALDASAQDAVTQARRQGVWTPPYQFAGQALGMAPYFAAPEAAIAPGIEALGALSEALPLAETTRALSVGAIQGAYEAAKAQDGERTKAFGTGMLEGTALGTAWETLGGIAGAVRDVHGVSPNEAQAVEAAAKNIATPKQEAQATSAVLNSTDVAKTVQDTTQQNVAAANKIGMPRITKLEDVPSAEQTILPQPVRGPKGQFQRLQVQMLGADGQPYSLGVDDNILPLLSNHLANGGQVIGLQGTKSQIQHFLKSVENLNAPQEVSIPLKGITPETDPPKPATVKTQLNQPKAYEPPQMVKDWLEKNPTADYNDIAQKFQFSDRVAQVVHDWWQDKLNIDTEPIRASSGPVALSDIPPYDNYGLLPNGDVLDKLTGQPYPDIETATKPPEDLDTATYGMVRGSSNVPLSLNGRTAVDQLGQDIRRKGSLDELEGADLIRHQQTLAAIAQHNPLTTIQPPNPRMRSWALGGIEGEEHTPAISREINRLVVNSNEIPEGMGRLSTSLGESFGNFAERVVDQVQQKVQRLIQNPDLKLGMVTSSRDIGLVKAWLGADGDLDKFNEIMMRSHENPGSVYRISIDENGQPQIRQVDMKSASQLQGGVYMIRHGETPWNASARKLTTKETPIGTRMVGSSPLTRESGMGGLTLGTTRLYKDTLDRSVIAHERYHGLTAGLGMNKDVMHLMDDPTTEQLYRRGFDPAVQRFYGDDPYQWREEVYAHSLDAIRTNDAPKIRNFIDADTDRETYFQWFRDKTQAHLDIAAEKPDSIYKRAYERSLNDANTRATRYLDDINNYFSQSEHELNLREGEYTLTDADGALTTYPSRESALRELEKFEQPLNTPELVGLDSLPDNVTRFARSVRAPDGKRPVSGDPTNPAVGGVRPARGGLDLLTAFIRPFHSWLAGVAERNDWPELYNAFRAIDDAQIEDNNFRRPYEAELLNTLGKTPHERQKDFLTWFATPDAQKAKVEENLLFKPEEVGMLNRVQEKILDPLANEFGSSLSNYVNQVLPRVKSVGDVWKAFPDEKADTFMTRALKLGRLSEDPDNFRQLVAHYLEFGSKNRFVNPAMDAASDEVFSKILVNVEGRDNPVKLPRAGNLLPLLKRHLEALRGKQDYTNQIVQGVMEGTADMINTGLRRVNSVLPKSMQIPEIKELSEDPLGKFTLFQYAGTLGLKPATLIRDALQYFITSYPVMGNYAFTGLKKVFPALKMNSEEANALWNTARDYGALIERRDLSSLYAAADEGSDFEHKAENFAKWTLGMIQFSHNANRLAAFWGHSEQVADALETFRRTQDLGKFNRQSGAWFLDKPLREQFNHEMQTLENDPIARQDFAHRMAARLTEASQWNMRRGSQPMLYDFSLGRLFGQYGTWPLNYIDYARRFAIASDKGAAMQGLTRLVLAHGAILAAGQQSGIDTGRWVFTQPGSDWQGGPMFQMLLDAPKAFDFDTAEGEEARHGIREEFIPGMVPGGAEAARIYEALATNDPDFWPKVLGFHVMASSDYNRGLHSLLPQK